MDLRLGKWAQYIEPAHLKWFPLPSQLIHDLERYTPDGKELDSIDWSLFEKRLRQLLYTAEATSTSLELVPYHNITHFREVLVDGQAIIDAYEELSDHSIPTLVQQAFAFALMTHDLHHPGATFFHDAIGMAVNVGKKEDVTLENVTVEWVSAKIADRLASAAGFNPLARLFIVNIIWASTYGANSPRGKELGLERIQPSTLYELAIVVADVAPTDSFLRWIEKGVNVLYKEIPAMPPPSTWTEFLQNRISFVDLYIIPKMMRLDGLAETETSLTMYLGWQSNAREYVRLLKEIKEDKHPMFTAIIRSMLPVNRVDLMA